MKASLKLYAVLFFGVFAASAWAGKFLIDSFDENPDPGEADNYIAEEFAGNGLKPVKPEQVTTAGGRFYVRQKFEDPFNAEEPLYQIFQGRPTESAKDLGKISIAGVPTKTLVRLKFFYSKTPVGDDDLETVYFDGKDVFVEGGDPVYAQLSGRIEELIPEIKREYKISIASQPSGANVNIGGVDKGVTPLEFTVTSPNVIGAVLRLDGYYTVIKPIKPNDKSVTQEMVTMTATDTLHNPTASLRAQLEAARANRDAATIKAVAASAKKALGTYNADFKTSVDNVMTKFPVNPPKVSGETDTDYSKRQTLWANEQTRERNELVAKGKEYFDGLKALSDEAATAANEIDFTLRYEYIPNSTITFTNIGPVNFILNSSVQNSRINFEYNKATVAYGSVARTQFASDQSRVHGVLKIWDTPDENGKYTSIYDAAFFYGETPLSIMKKGTFSVPDATAKSKATEKDLNARIAKYAGKAAWSERDAAATLEVLRAGEISDAPPAVAAVPEADEEEEEEEEEEAYYSEEEDEEEFEEESDEQEEVDYSRYGAAGNATDIFGNTDEYLFWTGMAFAAVAVGSGVMGVMQMMGYNEANKVYKSTQGEIAEVLKGITNACDSAVAKGKFSNVSECVNDAKNHASLAPTEDEDPTNHSRPLYELNKLLDHNKAIRDGGTSPKDGKKYMGYKLPMIAWFSGTGLALVTSITLFAW